MFAPHNPRVIRRNKNGVYCRKVICSVFLVSKVKNETPRGDVFAAAHSAVRRQRNPPRRAHGTFGAAKVSEWVRYFEKVPVITLGFLRKLCSHN